MTCYIGGYRPTRHVAEMKVHQPHHLHSLKPKPHFEMRSTKREFVFRTESVAECLLLLDLICIPSLPEITSNGRPNTWMTVETISSLPNAACVFGGRRRKRTAHPRNASHLHGTVPLDHRDHQSLWMVCKSLKGYLIFCPNNARRKRPQVNASCQERGNYCS